MLEDKKKLYLAYGLGLVLGMVSNKTLEASPLAPITGFAQSFIFNEALENGVVTVLETKKQYRTNSKGFFGPIMYPVGKWVTLRFEKPGYKTTQSATVLVPLQGLIGPYTNITFQVPSLKVYSLFALIMGAQLNEAYCHVATTITAYHKTLKEAPQGEENATVVLKPYVNETPFYLDIFKSGFLKDSTNPFSRDLKRTSKDGGVVFVNLPPRNTPYQLSAIKNGIHFSNANFYCQPGIFINISPPLGPMAQRI